MRCPVEEIVADTWLTGDFFGGGEVEGDNGGFETDVDGGAGGGGLVEGIGGGVAARAALGCADEEVAVAV